MGSLCCLENVNRQPSTVNRVNRVNRRQAYYSKSGNSARLYTNTSAYAVVVLPSS